MKKPRLISYFSSLLLAIAANFAFAVGLGVLQVDSQPGEPLLARVPLIDLGDVRPAELQVELASVADYRQASANRYEILSNIRLHIETNPDGAWLVLTTEQPIPESSSTLILDTTWAGGRILSQHLLTVGAAPAPELFPATPVNEPPPANEPGPAVGGELAEAGRQTIRTVSGDSLWRISERLAGENSVYLQQTMLALHRLNPEAFVNGDINRLRADAELRVPDLANLSALDQGAAQDETVRQAVAATTQPQPLAAPAPQASGQDDDANGQLSLVVENSEDDGQGGGDELDQRIRELEDQLALSLEEVDRVRIEQEELRSRLDDLDEQISMARQIIDLQQQELVDLQASLMAAAAEQARVDAEQAAAAAEAEALAAERESAASQFPQSLLENPVYLAIGAAILVLGLVLLMMLRGNRDEDDDEEEETFVVIGAGEAGDDEEEDAGEDVVEAEVGEIEAAAEDVDDTDNDVAGDWDGDDATDDDDEIAQESEEVEHTDAEDAPPAAQDEEEDADNASEAGDPDEEEGFSIDQDEAGEEEIAEQLNLAYSFHKMGETEQARKILENVIRSGNETQISEARQLLAILDDTS